MSDKILQTALESLAPKYRGIAQHTPLTVGMLADVLAALELTRARQEGDGDESLEPCVDCSTMVHPSNAETHCAGQPWAGAPTAAPSLAHDLLTELAEERCAYNDNCPDFGTRHGRCLACKARIALAEWLALPRARTVAGEQRSACADAAEAAFPREPRDDAEREAMDRGYGTWAMGGYPGRCNERHSEVLCTRLPSHDGDHVACGSLGVLARWPRTNGAPSV